MLQRSNGASLSFWPRRAAGTPCTVSRVIMLPSPDTRPHNAGGVVTRWRIWPLRNGGLMGACMLCAFMLSAMASSDARAATDSTIEVQGNRRVDPEAIREHVHAASNPRFTPAVIDAALKELYATGLFEDVKIAASGARLIVTVVEAPLIGRLRFEGNKQLKDKDLIKEIGSKPGGPMTKASVREDVTRIIEIYRRSGRYQVQVTPKTIARSGRVDLIFEIQEGAKTGVKRIAFVGNHESAESRLKGVIKTSESELREQLESERQQANQAQVEALRIRQHTEQAQKNAEQRLQNLQKELDKARQDKQNP